MNNTRKILFFLNILFCLFQFLCCKNDSNNEFVPIHIDAPAITIKAKNLHYATISFEPVENAKYYDYYYSEDNETFSAYGVYYDSSTTNIDAYCPGYTKQFFYRIIAYDRLPQQNQTEISKSEFSNTVSICLAEDSSLEVTEIEVAYANDDSVQLSWKELKSASAYNVYYGTNENIDEMQLALTTTDSTEIITNLDYSIEYYFCVKAIIDDEEKPASNVTSYNLSKYIPPIENITGSVILTKRNGIKYAKAVLDWDKTKNAERYLIKSFDFSFLYENCYTNHWEKELSEFEIRGGLPDSVDEINFFWTSKYRYHFTITAGTGKYSSDNKTCEIKLNDSINHEQKTKVDNDIGLKIEQSPAYPLILSWNKIDGISKYRLWYSYKTVDYQNAHYEDIEGTSKKFYGAWNSGYYFWLEPLPYNGSYSSSSPVYGMHPAAPSYDKETLDNSTSSVSNTSTSSSKGSKGSYTYYMSKYEYYYDQYLDYLEKAYVRKAKGDNAGYLTYKSMANGSKTSANQYYKWALECL